MENRISKDYFTRDFPYHKLEGLEEEEISDINNELEKIKNITKNIDIKKCYLTESININGIIVYDVISIGSKHTYCTAFYFLENESLEFSFSVHDINGIYEETKIKLPEDMYTLNISLRNDISLTNDIDNANLNTYKVLELSKGFDYIQPFLKNILDKSHLDNILERNNCISRNMSKVDNYPNIFVFPKTCNSRNVYTQIRNKDIHHNFGDKEIIIDDEKYIRCDIIRPFLPTFNIFGKFKKLYIEWIETDIINRIPCIRWVGDKIYYMC